MLYYPEQIKRLLDQADQQGWDSNTDLSVFLATELAKLAVPPLLVVLEADQPSQAYLETGVSNTMPLNSSKVTVVVHFKHLNGTDSYGEAEHYKLVPLGSEGLDPASSLADTAKEIASHLKQLVRIIDKKL